VNRWGWNAELAVSAGFDRARLLVWRDSGPGRIEYLVAEPVVHTAYADVVADPVPGIWLPRGADRALIEALTPSTTAGEIARLEEALAGERARVDLVLGELLRGRA
jgi:hypothetical protein